MKTLISPVQVLRLAFSEGGYLPPETVTEADIAAAEQRYLRPVLGAALYDPDANILNRCTTDGGFVQVR